MDGVTIGVAGEVEVLDEQLSEDDIEGRLSIKIEDEDGEFEGEEWMLDSFCDQDSRQLMTTTFLLELRLSLVEIPVVNVEIPDV